MTDISIFESRHGTVSCDTREAYAFVTDIRNFERFVKKETLTNWKAEKEFCSFSVPMMGTVTVRIAEKKEFNKVVFEGDALKKNDFTLALNMIDNTKNEAYINVILSADLNPMMKMMAKKPIEQFLEKLIEEMEKFREWKDIR
jgi:hypothetical protein